MSKEKMIKEIVGMIEVIRISPELFHDGIDEEIISVLQDTVKYIKKTK